MQIRHYKDVPVVPYAAGIQKRVMLGPKQDAPTFVMRIFDLPPGASSPWHQHDWEHEVYVLAGRGLGVSAEGEAPIRRDDAILLPANEMHCLKNTGRGVLRFMCLVPLRGEDTP